MKTNTNSSLSTFPMSGQTPDPISGYSIPPATIERLLCLPPVQLVKLLLQEYMAKSELCDFIFSQNLGASFLEKAKERNGSEQINQNDLE